jgi:hypothetical protein
MLKVPDFFLPQPASPTRDKPKAEREAMLNWRRLKGEVGIQKQA